MLPSDFEHKSYHFTLRDGTEVILRKVTPEDKKRIQEGFQQFSPRSRYMRFFSHIRQLTKSQLAYLTEIDYRTHMAWGLVRKSDPDSGIAIARMVMLPENEKMAEIAISVIDTKHSMGAGMILMAALNYSAIARNITTFRSYILLENKTLVESMKKINSVFSYKEKGVFEVETPVLSHESDFPDSNTGRILKQQMLEFYHQAIL